VRGRFLWILAGLTLTAGTVKADEVQVSSGTLSAQSEFLKDIAADAQIPPEDLRALDKPGLRKMETLILALLHKKTGAEIPKLLEQRKKGVRLSRIIMEENQDEREIYREAWTLKKEIDEK
jgi:hypothetical protein